MHSLHSYCIHFIPFTALRFIHFIYFYLLNSQSVAFGDYLRGLRRYYGTVWIMTRPQKGDIQNICCLSCTLDRQSAEVLISHWYTNRLLCNTTLVGHYTDKHLINFTTDVTSLCEECFGHHLSSALSWSSILAVMDLKLTLVNCRGE